MKIPKSVYLFFILIYGNQGLSDLASQSEYYLTRETWKLSATTIGLIGLLSGLAWYIKPLFGLICDRLPIKGYRTKYYMIFNTCLMILCCIYVCVYGFSLISLIIIAMLYNIALGFNDVCNDTQMVKIEQEHKLQGKIQAIQWTSLAVTGILVSFLGAYLASNFSEPWNYKIAHAIMMSIPILTLIYFFKNYKEEKEVKKSGVKIDFSGLKNKEFIIGLVFILLLKFSPSFGTGLMITMRENLHIDKMFMGYLGMTGTVLGIVGYILYYAYFHKINLKKMLYVTIALSALMNLCYLYIPNKEIIMLYNVMFGAFDGIAFLTIMSFMVQIIPKGSEGLMYALVTGVSNFSGRLSGVFGGFIYDNWGYTMNVILASITTLLCLFMIPKLIIKQKDLTQVEQI